MGIQDLNAIHFHSKSYVTMWKKMSQTEYWKVFHLVSYGEKHHLEKIEEKRKEIFQQLKESQYNMDLGTGESWCSLDNTHLSFVFHLVFEIMFSIAVIRVLSVWVMLMTKDHSCYTQELQSFLEK